MSISGLQDFAPDEVDNILVFIAEQHNYHVLLLERLKRTILDNNQPVIR